MEIVTRRKNSSQVDYTAVSGKHKAVYLDKSLGLCVYARKGFLL